MSGASRRKPKYSGILNEPIVRPNLLLASKEEADHVVLTAQIERIEALKKYYELESSASYLSLLLALARDHVPGFQILSSPTKKSGAPNEYIGGGQKGFKLWALVEVFKTRPEINSVTAAIEAIVKEFPEFTDSGQEHESKSLRKRYYDACKHNHLVTIVKSIGSKYGAPDLEIAELAIESLNRFT
jgi:hypothetical protein